MVLSNAKRQANFRHRRDLHIAALERKLEVLETRVVRLKQKIRAQGRLIKTLLENGGSISMVKGADLYRGGKDDDVDNSGTD